MISAFEHVVREIHEVIGDPLLRLSIFRVAEHERGHLRRVLWIPTDYESVPLEWMNPLCVDGEKRTAIGADRVSVEAHITGESFADIELLRARVMSAVRQVMGTDSESGGGHYVTQDAERAQFMAAGAELVVQRFAWTFVVLEPTGDGGSGSVTIIKHIDTDDVQGATTEPLATMHAPDDPDE